MMNVIFERYNLINILQFLKKYMFCERGDKIDDFLEVIVKENSEIAIASLFQSSSLFDEEDFLEVNILFNICVQINLLFISH